MTDGHFEPNSRAFLRTAFRLGDIVAMALAFAVALTSIGLSHADVESFLSIRMTIANVLLFLLFCGAWTVVFRAFGLYRGRRFESTLRELYELARAVGLGTLLLATASVLFRWQAVDGVFLALFAACSLGATAAYRFVTRLLLGEVRRRGRNLRNLIIVGQGPRGQAIESLLLERPELGYNLLGFVDNVTASQPAAGDGKKLLGAIDDLELLLLQHRVDELLVALPVKSHYEVISRILAMSEELGILVRMPADFFRLEIARAEVDYLENLPIMTLRTPSPSFGGLVVKRCFDLAVALPALLALLPAFAVIAAAIRLDSNGRVWFRQLRIGLNRRPFHIVKFRTMVADAERQLGHLEPANEVTGAAFKIRDDPRVTRLGRLLRRYSLDELPQLWNVIKGEMSIVGPRPLPLRDVDAFDSRWLNRRFSVKPGLTCLWQASGRHNIPFERWMEMDLQYIDHWSFGLDLEIMLRTVPSVLRGTGAS